MNTQKCMALIEKVIEQKVRPTLQDHNGDIKIEAFKDGVLYVSMLGQCCDCAMASVTNEQLIKAELQRVIPEVQDVVLIPHVDIELWAFAQQILQNGGLFKKEEDSAGMSDKNN